jgi:hypothetical protein
MALVWSNFSSLKMNNLSQLRDPIKAYFNLRTDIYGNILVLPF